MISRGPLQTQPFCDCMTQHTEFEMKAPGFCYHNKPAANLILKLPGSQGVRRLHVWVPCLNPENWLMLCGTARTNFTCQSFCCCCSGIHTIQAGRQKNKIKIKDQSLSPKPDSNAPFARHSSELCVVSVCALKAQT